MSFVLAALAAFPVNLVAAQSADRDRARDEILAKLAILRFDLRLSVAALAANPFRYREQIIVVQNAQFVRMIAEDEAIFRDGSERILVSKVPSTKFAGNEWVALAIKVKGIKSATSELGLPYGELVSVYLCKVAGCFDLLDSGLRVPQESLRFRREYVDAIPVLVISGEILNESDKQVRVRPFRIMLLDRRSEELRTERVLINDRTLEPGKRLPFQTSIPNPPPEAAAVRITFE